jgi:hypothetical protein
MEEFVVTGEMLRKRPEMIRDGYKASATVPGRVLHAKYSRYMQRVAEGRAGAGGRARRGGRALHPPQLDRADRHDLAVARPTMPATASSRASRTTTAAT